MIIYLLFIIPIVTAAILLIFYKKNVVWWEIVILFLVASITIFAAKALSERAKTKDIEYWGNLATQVEYIEDWDEEVTYTESCNCRTDSKGNTSCDTCIRTRIDYHPPQWNLYYGIGESISIDSGKYNELVSRWGNNPIFIDLHRDYHNNDGDKYTAKWDRKRNTAEPIITIHNYENRVQAANDVFNFPEVSLTDKMHYGLYDYSPVSDYKCQNILGGGGIKDFAIAEKELSYLNGILGESRELRLWILIFRNKTIDAAKHQEMLWKGGNKNEFIFCIGIDPQHNVQWSHIISWTENQKLKIEARDFISSMKTLDLMKLVSFIETTVSRDFKRKRFREFSYLSVEPSGLAIAISAIVVLIVNIICAIIIASDSIDINSHRKRRTTYNSGRWSS